MTKPKSSRAAQSVAGLPLASSWTTGMKLWELSAIAPLVIGYRLAGMAQAGLTPNAGDRREVARMGQEKLDAWSEATLATGQRLLETNMHLASLFWRQAWGGTFSPATLTAALARLGPSLLTDALTPAHRRVVANHHRLARSR